MARQLGEPTPAAGRDVERSGAAPTSSSATTASPRGQSRGSNRETPKINALIDFGGAPGRYVPAGLVYSCCNINKGAYALKFFILFAI